MRHDVPNIGTVLKDGRITILQDFRSKMKLHIGDFYEVEKIDEKTLQIRFGVQMTQKKPNSGTIIADWRITLPRDFRNEMSIKYRDLYEMTQTGANTVTVKILEPPKEKPIEEEKMF